MKLMKFFLESFSKFTILVVFALKKKKKKKRQTHNHLVSIAVFARVFNNFVNIWTRRVEIDNFMRIVKYEYNIVTKRPSIV